MMPAKQAENACSPARAGDKNEMAIQDVSSFAAEGESLSFWQLQVHILPASPSPAIQLHTLSVHLSNLCCSYWCTLCTYVQAGDTKMPSSNFAYLCSAHIFSSFRNPSLVITCPANSLQMRRQVPQGPDLLQLRPDAGCLSMQG